MNLRHPGRAHGFAAKVLAFVLSAMAAYASASAAPRDLSFAERQKAMLANAIAHPFPRPDCPAKQDPGSACVWGKLNYGLAALYLGDANDELQAGNDAIRSALSIMAGLPEQVTIGGRRTAQNYARREDRFSFLTAGLLARIYFLFTEGSAAYSNRLEAENAKQIAQEFWKYARSQCPIGRATAVNIWRPNASENISIMADATCWAAAQILSVNPACQDCRYDDGSSPREQLAAWTKFIEEYIREHARYGGFTEFFSPTYYKYTLQNFYNFAEFSDDPELRRLSRSMLDLWWAQWAQEQIYGFHGGSKTRAMATAIGHDRVGLALGWLYFGIEKASGRPEEAESAGNLVSMVASAYRPPAIVSDIATNIVGRGSYVVKSRTTGLSGGSSGQRDRAIDAAAGGILRYAYVTPSFVLSTNIIAKLPLARWIPFSAQNRWSGLTLSDGSLIFARPVYRDGNARSYNDVWGVQSFGTQIVQKIRQPLSRGAGQMAAWIDPKLNVTRESDWIFIDADAYVALRPAFGGFSADERRISPDATQIAFGDDTSPVIIQASDKSEFATFADFKDAILKAPLSVDGNVVQFRGLGRAGTISFFYDSNQLPQIDGQTVDVSPARGLDSPFVRSNWGDGKIVISNGSKRMTLDFN